jgi:hypothetical protein
VGSSRSERNRQRSETERYRKAAEAALESLDWTINYFHRIRKSKVAEVLQENRKEIVRRLRAR